MAGKKSNSEVLRDMREKNAGKKQKVAKAAKTPKQPKAKKQPSPAKPKQEPVKKVASKKGKPEQLKKDGLLAPGSLRILKGDAERILPQVRTAVEKAGNALSEMVLLDSQLQDVRDRELWRYCETPFKSWTAYVQDLKSVAGKSAATLFGIIGLQKALPGSTAEERRKIGPRKGARVAAAAKQAGKKGKKLSPEIIEKAKDPESTEDDLVSEIAAAGLGPEQKPQPDNRQMTIDVPPDPLLANTGGNTKPEKLSKGGSGKVEGQPGDAMQFGGRLNVAVMQWSTLYSDPKAREPLGQMERLEQVCIMFGEAPVDLAQVEDDSVRPTLEAHMQGLPEDAIFTNEQAYELLMHQPRMKTKA